MTQIIIIKIKAFQIRHVAGLSQVHHAFVSNLVSRHIEMDQISHSVSGGDELGPKLA